MDPIPNLADDITKAAFIVTKVKRSRSYAQNLYAAMCNMQWQKNEMWPVLKDQLWSASWRHSGALVAAWGERGEDYMDYYCSGLGDVATYDTEQGKAFMLDRQYVKEGVVTQEILADLSAIGWSPVPYKNEEK